MMKRLLIRILNKLTGQGLRTALDDYLPEDGPLTLIDVGAHNGGFTESILRRRSQVGGLLIEPLPEQAEGLKAKFSDRGFRVINAAVSSEEGEVVLNRYGFAETSSILALKEGMSELDGFDTSPKAAVRCPMVTLDSVAGDLPKIDLLKIDVQGAEHLVLAGAKHTLAKTGLVWIEVSFKPLYDGSSVFHEIYALFETAGFRLVSLSPGFRSSEGELVQADALFQKR